MKLHILFSRTTESGSRFQTTTVSHRLLRSRFFTILLITMMTFTTVIGSMQSSTYARALSKSGSDVSTVDDSVTGTPTLGLVTPIPWNYFQTGGPIPITGPWEQKLLDAAADRLADYTNDGGPNTYLDFGTTCSGIRLHTSNASALAMFVIMHQGSYYPSGFPYSESTARSRTINLVKSLAYRHIANSPNGWGTHPNSDPCVGGPTPDTFGNAQVPFWASMAGFAGWLMWGYLSDTDREYVRKMVEYEADAQTNPIYCHDPFGCGSSIVGVLPRIDYMRDENGNVHSGFEGDTQADTVWNSRILQLAIAMMPNHPHIDMWMNKNMEITIASFATPQDALDQTTMLHGKTLKSWLNGSNIESEGTVVNHGDKNPNYMNLILHEAHSALVNSLARRSTPAANLFRAQTIYSAFVNLQIQFLNGGNCSSFGGHIFHAGDPNICFPQLPSPWADEVPNYASLTLVDVEAHAFGFDSGLSQDGAYWELLHIQNFPDVTSNNTEVAKVAEAYLAKWLSGQSYSSAYPLQTSEVPSPWQDQDLGALIKAGRGNYSNGTFTVVGSGSGTATADQIHFAYQAWEGDGEIVAQRASWGTSNSKGDPKAFLTMREDFSPGSRYVSVGQRKSDSATYYGYRLSPDTSDQSTFTGSGNWMKIKRFGNQFDTLTSSDGENWNLINSQTINMGSRIYIGLGISSFNNGNLATVNFSNVSLTRSEEAQLSNTSTSVVASSYQTGNPPESSRDGDFGTRWSAMSNPSSNEWIRYDLGAPKRVGSVAIAWYMGDQRIFTFDIQVSIDSLSTPLDNSWTTVFSGTSTGSKTDTQYERYYFMPVRARHIRIIGHGNSWSLWNSLNEVAIFGTPLSLVATEAPSASTYQYPNTPANTVDNYITTRWSAQGDQWIEYPLSSNTSVNAIAIGWYFGDQRTSTFDVTVQGSNGLWYAVLSGAKSTGTTLAQEFYSFSMPQGVSAVSRVRIVGHGNSWPDSGWNSITEVRIYQPPSSDQ